MDLLHSRLVHILIAEQFYQLHRSYVESISDDEHSNHHETTWVIDANKVHDRSAYGDYLNSQFDDLLRSFQNLNQCNASNDIAVINKDKDKEILENPCSLNKD